MISDNHQFQNINILNKEIILENTKLQKQLKENKENKLISNNITKNNTCKSLKYLSSSSPEITSSTKTAFNCVDVLLIKGQMEYNQDNIVNSIEYFNKVIELEKSNLMALKYLIKSLFALGDYYTAYENIQLFSNILEEIKKNKKEMKDDEKEVRKEIEVVEVEIIEINYEILLLNYYYEIKNLNKANSLVKTLKESISRIKEEKHEETKINEIVEEEFTYNSNKESEESYPNSSSSYSKFFITDIFRLEREFTSILILLNQATKRHEEYLKNYSEDYTKFLNFEKWLKDDESAFIPKMDLVFKSRNERGIYAKSKIYVSLYY